MSLSLKDRPRWPQHLKDETPLPYSVWHIVNRIDGKQTVGEIMALTGASLDEVTKALEQVENWVSRAVKREQVVTEPIIDSVSQCLMSVVGPMGEFMVEDSLDEVGSEATLSQLLASLANQLEEQHLHAFVRQLRSKGLA